MKITPIAGGGSPGTVLGNAEVGQSAGPDRKAAALKAFKGEAQGSVIEKQDQFDPQAQRIQKKRTLVMKTKATPEVSTQTFDQDMEAQAIETANPEHIETAQASEETKPLSPQFAALARQKRALQVKEREIADREKALETAQPNTSGGIDLAILKSDPLSVLQQAGVLDSPEFYNSLTERIMNGQSGSQRIDTQSLKKELIAAIKEDLNKDLSERDVQAEQQVLSQMKREAEYIVSKDDSYEMIRSTKSVQDVVDLIRRTWKKTGEVMDVPEALQAVEEQLQEEILPLAKLKKIQSRLSAAQNPQQQQTQGQMRTLTSRDGATPPLSAKQRAMAAFNGTLRKG